MLRSYISCDLYGQEAVDVYVADPDQMGFDCWYISDARSFTELHAVDVHI